MLTDIKQLEHTGTGMFFLIAGPCVVEDHENPFRVAEHMQQVCQRLQIPYLFKASYRKANRSSVDSFAGIGDLEALRVLREVGERYHVPVVTDIHSKADAWMAADYADVLQIPAFLCRQSDLLKAAAETGRIVNVKKGQFLSPDAMAQVARKMKVYGARQTLLTERGTTFGYQDLVVDFRSVPIMQRTGLPVVVDITHSLQQPNQASGVTGGQPDMIETIARAAVAVGADGLFMETHPEPARAKSDGANMLRLDLAEPLLRRLVAIRKAIISLH